MHREHLTLIPGAEKTDDCARAGCDQPARCARWGVCVERARIQRLEEDRAAYDDASRARAVAVLAALLACLLLGVVLVAFGVVPG